MPIFITSLNNNHRHLWERKKKSTFKANGHVHKIDLKRKLALPTRKGAHSHKLLSVKVRR